MGTKKKVAKRVKPIERKFTVERFISDLKQLDDETVWFIAIYTQFCIVNEAARIVLSNRGIGRGCEYVGTKRARQHWAIEEKTRDLVRNKRRQSNGANRK